MADSITHPNTLSQQSVVIIVRSPALAAYTLALTSINARSVYRRAQRIKHQNKNSVARILISLQQTPLEPTRDERLLSFLPINDKWKFSPPLSVWGAVPWHTSPMGGISPYLVPHHRVNNLCPDLGNSRRTVHHILRQRLHSFHRCRPAQSLLLTRIR